MRICVVAFAALSLLGACAPVVGHGPEIAMPAAWRSDVRVDRLVASSRWVVGERPFPETMTGAVADAMRACAGSGTRPLELRLHIERHGRGNARTVEGRAEFVDMRTREVVARMPIVASAAAADERKASRRFARQICRGAFAEDVASR
ncbi:MAG: hypothetical protein V4574_09845 [Pseudomonadota bacterium]